MPSPDDMREFFAGDDDFLSILDTDMPTPDKIRAELEKVFNKLKETKFGRDHLAAFVVFGSSVRNGGHDATKISDIDIAVIFKDISEDEFKDRKHLIDEALKSLPIDFRSKLGGNNGISATGKLGDQSLKDNPNSIFRTNRPQDVLIIGDEHTKEVEGMFAQES